MGYEEILKNVKDGLLKAANEGKKKALLNAYPKIKDAFDKTFEEAKTKFFAELEQICGVNVEDSTSQQEEK